MKKAQLSVLVSLFAFATTSAFADDPWPFVGKVGKKNTKITAAKSDDGDTAILLAKVWGSKNSYPEMADRICDLFGYDFASSYKTKSVRRKRSEKQLKDNFVWALDPTGRTSQYGDEGLVRVWENYTQFKEVTCEGRGPKSREDTHKNSDGSVTVYSHNGSIIFYDAKKYYDEEDPEVRDAGLASAHRYADHVCALKVGKKYKARSIGNLQGDWQSANGYELYRDEDGNPQFEESFRTDSYAFFSKVVCDR